MTGCLGPHLAALADGSLSPRRRERALAHVASCDRCRHALEAQRSVRACLATAAVPEPPRDLTDRLLDLPLVCWLPSQTVDLVAPADPGPAVECPPARGGQPGTPSSSRASRLVLVGGTASIVTVAGLAALAAAPTAATSVPVGLTRAPAALSEAAPAAAPSPHGLSVVSGTAATAAFVAPAASRVTTPALPRSGAAADASRLGTVSSPVPAGLTRTEFAALVVRSAGAARG